MLQLEFYISGKKVVYLFLNAISRTLMGKAPQYHLLFSQFSSWLPRVLVVVQSLSHLWVFATPWTAAHQASLSFIISQSLLKLMSMESVLVSNHLILCCPLLLWPSIFDSIRVFSSESALGIKWPKYWNFTITVSPSNEYSGLISFRSDWFDLLTVQGTLESPPTSQFRSINSLACSLYGPAVTSVHDYWKNHSFNYMDLLLAKWCFCILIP